MADFVSEFWSWFIIIPVILGLLGCIALVIGNSTGKPAGGKPETMGHVWDGDLAEYNNPLPKWWLNMFYITIAFGFVYLALYPGLGSFKGLLGWSELGQYEQEVASVTAANAELYQRYGSTPIPQLAEDAEAMKTAKRIYATNCSVCHGTDARGAKGFPNLRDSDWLYGSKPELIKASIANGRSGVMPGWEQALLEQEMEHVAEYVISLSRESLNPFMLANGEQKYKTLCIACHGADGTGNQALGAPNLTDNIWLYGGSKEDILKTLTAGRNGIMPAHDRVLDENRIHLLTAYVYSFTKSSR